MNSYFSTFITGFSNVVIKALKENIPDIKIDLLLDGLVSYRTKSSYYEIEKLRFLNNTYSLIYLVKNSTERPFSELRDWIKDENEFGNLVNNQINPKTNSLKLTFVENNQYVHLDHFFTKNLLSLITNKTHLATKIQEGNQELWMLVRKEGYSLIGLRLPKNSDSEKPLSKGELKPELANLLCLLSEPSEGDIFLDPFAGSGSIPLERSKDPYTKIVAIDNNSKLVDSLKNQFKNSEAEVYNYDTLQLSALIGRTKIDKIVTDPPWGLFEDNINIGAFYPQLLKEFYKVLNKNGIVVLLVSQSIDLEKILESMKDKYKIENKISTLVNGQKAFVYKVIRL